jgi:hypothetical protein
MDYKDLILLKSLFNYELHDAINNLDSILVNEIMKVNYGHDIALHNINDFGFRITLLKMEHDKNLEDSLKWAL